MPVSARARAAGKELVLSPQEPLTAGASAAELERQIQSSFRRGVQHVVVDLRSVPAIDSFGVRALVRGYTSAQRLGRHFTLVGPNARVLQVIKLAHLDRILQICDSMDFPRTRQVSWDRLFLWAAVALIGLSLVGVGLRWPFMGLYPPPLEPSPFGVGEIARPWSNPMFEFAKLVVAGVVGILVTAVHRRYRADREPNPTMDQAQVLLCVSGALMMIIIGNSLVRAFGIAGAASIIRFRTPVDDPKDITVLFILMGLGMASGLGGFALAGLGTLFLCAMLPLLNIFSSERPRLMLVEIVAEGRDFPHDHVEQVFAVNQVTFEPREVSQGDEATMRYLTTLRADASLEDLSSQLMGDARTRIKNVAWSPPKRV